MLSGQRLVTVVGLLAAGALAGCYASTEPATDVGPDNATLHAQGTANNGAARSYFEYWFTGSTGRVRTAGEFRWPAGASGPFSQKLDGLAADAPYSFRICGADDDGSDPICAQTRTFSTTAAVEDAAHGGQWAGCCYSFGVNATSGPSGENPQGTMNLRTGSSFDPVQVSFTGTVTCLAVDGTRAAIGAVGTRSDTTGASGPATLVATVEDGRANQDLQDEEQLQPGSTPPDCSTASFENLGSVREDFEFVVNDAAP